ncbi:MAG: hypothetical protein KGJ06_05405 [Pseudomonadota bacterium]|nr:hypothetical protein [Pseudomonadota bacterium]
MLNRKNRSLIFVLTMLLFPSAAQAAVITNLSGKPQEIQVGAGDAPQKVTIDPNDTYRASGELVVRYAGHETHMDDNDEYVIWPGGAFGPQRKNSHGTLAK